MLSSLRIGNFKAFSETQHIPIRPLTLIFGPNSSGKSSLIHSLALVHEANQSGNFDIFNTKIGGTSIDLGGFRQYIHRKDPFRNVEWGGEIRTENLTGWVSELLSPVKAVGITLQIAMEHEELKEKRQIFDKETLKTKTVEVPSGKYKPVGDPSVSFFQIEVDHDVLLRMSRRGMGEFRIDHLQQQHEVIERIVIAILQSKTTTDHIGENDIAELSDDVTEMTSHMRGLPGNLFPSGIRGDEKEKKDMDHLFAVSKGQRKEDLAQALNVHLKRIINELISGVTGAFKNEIERLQYLGPLRSYPPRHLAFSEHEDINWYAGGGYAWDKVRYDEKIRDSVNQWLGSKDRLKTPYKLMVQDLLAIDQINTQLEESIEKIELDMEPEEDFAFPVVKDAEAEAERITREIKSYDVDRISELILIDQRTNTIVSHKDVGIGISQVMPVLVTAYGTSDSIIAIEQPEIHLHPALQAELGDVFIESALGGNKNTFILESHSEHLILRILRRIRETTDGELPKGLTPITTDQVAVLYVQPEKNGSEIIHIPVTEDGEFEKPWPEGFFAERAKELF